MAIGCHVHVLAVCGISGRRDCAAPYSRLCAPCCCLQGAITLQQKHLLSLSSLPHFLPWTQAVGFHAVLDVGPGTDLALLEVCSSPLAGLEPVLHSTCSYFCECCCCRCDRLARSLWRATRLAKRRQGRGARRSHGRHHTPLLPFPRKGVPLCLMAALHKLLPL